MGAKIRWLGWWVCALAAVQAYGAFVKPSRDQLKAAAEDPSQIVALIEDASIDQAAETGKDVIIQITKLDLDPEDRDARIASVVGYLFLSIPEDDWTALAIALGKFIAASPTASMSPDMVSAVQRSINEVSDVEDGDAFGNAYNLAMQTVAGMPGGGKTVPPQPPPPPVAIPPIAQLYEGQRLP